MDYKYLMQKLEKKQFVSQSHDDDVFVYNVRRALLINIPKDRFEKFYLTLNTSDQEFISGFYKPGKKIDPSGYSVDVYQLQTVCYQIEETYFEAVFNHEKLNSDDKTLLAGNYVKVKDKYILKREYEELADLRINRLFNNNDIYLQGDDNFKTLCDLLETSDLEKCSEVFLGRMFINIDHPYFYRKDYEHIPGMMLIETARQFGYAVSHHFLNVPLEDVIFGLTDLNVKFHEYVQSNLPVYLKAVNESAPYDPKKTHRDVGFLITIHQRNKEVARINIHAKSMKKDIFLRMRKGYENDYYQRFIPSSKFCENGYFINIYTQKKYKGQITEISLQGSTVSFNSNLDFTTDDRFEFFMYINTIGIIQGICILTGYKTENNITTAHFSFEVLDSSDKDNLKEGIKKYTFMLENQ